MRVFRYRSIRTCKNFVILISIGILLQGCLGASKKQLIKADPLPIKTTEDGITRFTDNDDLAAIEIRTTKIDKPVENLAIHYQSLFPDAENIKTADSEEYLKIDNKNAYRVVFRPTYIRQRKRVNDSSQPDSGWKNAQMEDPITGKIIDVMSGPIIPRQKILYLVEGQKYVYYILLRADGDQIDQAKRSFEDFVKNGINYQ